MIPVVFSIIFMYEFSKGIIKGTNDFYLRQEEVERSYHKFVDENGYKPTNINELREDFDYYTVYDNNFFTEDAFMCYYVNEKNYQHYKVDEHKIEAKFRRGSYGCVLIYFIDSDKYYEFEMRFSD